MPQLRSLWHWTFLPAWYEAWQVLPRWLYIVGQLLCGKETADLLYLYREYNVLCASVAFSSYKHRSLRWTDACPWEFAIKGQIDSIGMQDSEGHRSQAPGWTCNISHIQMLTNAMSRPPRSPHSQCSQESCNFRKNGLGLDLRRWLLPHMWRGQIT